MRSYVKSVSGAFRLHVNMKIPSVKPHHIITVESKPTDARYQSPGDQDKSVTSSNACRHALKTTWRQDRRKRGSHVERTRASCVRPCCATAPVHPSSTGRIGSPIPYADLVLSILVGIRYSCNSCGLGQWRPIHCGILYALHGKQRRYLERQRLHGREPTRTW
jgi:hypothetical protein